MAAAGKTLCLLDGTYQGDANMLRPPTGLSGASGKPIVVRALNDGAVTFDGQFQREPVILNGNAWWVLEGFNAKSSSRTVVLLRPGSHNSVLRRIVAWDANIAGNETVFFVWSSNNVLLEDVAGFGAGRKIISLSQDSSTGVTCRRCWGRWEGSIRYDPKQTFSSTYNGYNITCENCVGTWSGESQPQSFTVPPDGPGAGISVSNFGVIQAYGILSMDTGGPTCWNTQYLGSLAYVKPTDRIATNDPVFRQSTFLGAMFDVTNCANHKHVFAFIHPSNPSYSSAQGIYLGQDNASHSADHITSVSNGNTFNSSWTVTNLAKGGTIAAVPSPWTADTGANLCYRWMNGTPTTSPLWPWPMNARIKAATAVAGSYTGPCPGCVGGRGTRTATDVTADVESLLGTIPTQCKN